MIDINKIRNNKDEIEKALLKRLDNVNLDEVLEWDKENNVILKTYLEKPKYSFKIKPHYEILKDLKMVDYERGRKIAGEKNWIYKGIGAKWI